MGRLSMVLAGLLQLFGGVAGSGVLHLVIAPLLFSYSCCCCILKELARVCRSSHNWHARPAFAAASYSTLCISLPSIGNVLCPLARSC
uniref:HDC18185 n=1 Tax=Drosophila melanogaster TaxID=7227 RepID=Q6IIH9_DROME|nr:TPA_inf: HDC18185 [Drosophila melanogaster]